MALGLTQPLTEMSIRNISCGGVLGVSPSSADCHEIWEPQPPGTLRERFTFIRFDYMNKYVKVYTCLCTYVSMYVVWVCACV